MFFLTFLPGSFSFFFKFVFLILIIIIGIFIIQYWNVFQSQMSCKNFFKLILLVGDIRFGIFLFVLKKTANTIKLAFHFDNRYQSWNTLAMKVKSFSGAKLKSLFFFLKTSNIFQCPPKSSHFLSSRIVCFLVVS